MVNEKHNLLRLLIENQDEKFSIRKFSILRKINYKSAYNAVMKLKDDSLVNLDRIGNTICCSFTRSFDPLVFSVEYERRKDLFKNKDFKVLQSYFEDINYQFIILLFGSQVKKTQTKHSDIDLLIITEEDEEIKDKISLIPLNIHPTIITNKEFLIMAKSKEFSVVSEAMRKNIILIGIEDYYRLLKKC